MSYFFIFWTISDEKVYLMSFFNPFFFLFNFPLFCPFFPPFVVHGWVTSYLEFAKENYYVIL
jgi:hypothetical protein